MLQPNRRATLAAFSALALPAVALPAEERRRSFRVGVSTYSFWHFKGAPVPIETCLEKAADMGFDGVEILHVHMEEAAKAAGGTVKITASVDPSIVGGVVARVGSTVYDGSVTRQLERLKSQLINSQSK